MIIEYKGSMLTNDGWQNVKVTAKAEQVSKKKVKILKVTAINGDPIDRWMLWAGTTRPSFSGDFFAEREVEKIKNLSSCVIIDDK